MKHALATPAPIVRPAEIRTGTTFVFAGRLLRVERVTGSDAAAPVIVEELMDGPIMPDGAPAWYRGQFALWSADGVGRAIAGMLS